jgi:hypothetical protein
VASGDIVLQFGLEEGRNADAVIAAEALIAWVDTVRDAARALDPTHDIRVELLGREEGSLRQLLRLVDDQVGIISDGADEYPYLKKAAIGLAVVIGTSGLSTYIGESLKPQVQQVSLSAKDRALFEDMTAKIKADPATAKSAERFYKVVERDRAISNVQIANGFDEPPAATVLRNEFAFRSGVWAPETTAPVEEARHETWPVVLLQAPFYNSPRHWMFYRDGMKFSAQMQDAIFLQAITDRTIPITLQEGVTMTVEVEWRERLNGQIWEYVPDSRKIVRVLSPRPVARSPDLDAGNPKEGN